MMENFTCEIKNELLDNGFESPCCKRAGLSAFLRASGSLKYIDNLWGFEIVSESEEISAFFIGLLENQYGENIKITNIGEDKLSGKVKLAFECISESSVETLIELGIILRDDEGLNLNISVDKYVIENECCKLAYIIGAFLGNGSCTLPSEENQTGYHLEFIFSNELLAIEFSELLCYFDILSKITTRKDKYIVYLKSSDSISDFLKLVRAEKSLLKFSNKKQEREKNNNKNRVANCIQGNIDRSVTASVKQLKAIMLIDETIGIYELDEQLKVVALARLEDTNLSLNELATKLNISKSCLNHRMRKLMEIASALGE